MTPISPTPSARALAATGLDVDPEAVRLLLLRTLPEDASGFIQAGRNRDDNQGTGSTIACVSGFVVNMFERSVRLVTPVAASDEHPTGEMIFDTATFTDGVSFEDMLRQMIGRHMHETIGLADLFGTRAI